MTYGVTSYCFDLSVYEIFYTLSVGKQLRILTNALEIPRWLEEDSKVLLNTVPSVVQHLITERTSLHNVEALNMAGEPIPLSLIQKLDTQNMETRNLYGPSEYATYSTCYQFLPKNDQVLIGKPLDNTQVYILNKHLQHMPIGLQGEIYIAGPHLSEGYINRPELTQEKFIKSPFASGQFLYKTGDLGYWNEQGDIVFCGRKDYQVKIRGYRIELGEIESALTSCEGVKHGAVLAIEHQDGEKNIMAFYAGEERDRESIIATLKEKLPSFMIPHNVVFLEKFPLLPNGKTDRKKLSQYEVSKENTQFVQPENPQQQTLVGIWEEVLKKEPIGIEDSFFELGGESLKAMRLTSRIFQNFGVNISLKDIFNHPTIRELSEFLTSRESVEQSTEIFHEEKDLAENEQAWKSYPISFSQRRMWVTSQFNEAESAYNMPYQFEMEEVDLEAFRQTMLQLLERHEILRTTFSPGEEEPQQLIWDLENFEFNVEYEDLSQHEAPRDQFRQLWRAFVNQSFDLVNGPLLRVKVVKLEEKRTKIFLNMHHIISDAWSMSVLRKDFSTIYNSLLQGEEPSLKPLKVQYKDFAIWQHQQFAEGKMNHHRDYWHTQFPQDQQYAPATLITDYPRPPIKTYNGASVEFNLGGSIHRKFEKICFEDNSSLFIGILSLVKVMIYKYTHNGDIVVGSPVARRERADLEDQIGFYVNTLPLRTNIDAKDSFVEVCRKVKQVVYGGLDHQDYPFDLLVDDLSLDREMSRSPLFDIVVSTESFDTDFIEKENVITRKDEVSKFEIDFQFSIGNNGLQIVIRYNSDLFEKERITQMAYHVKELIHNICQNPHRPVGELNIQSPAQEAFLLDEINDTSSDYPTQQNVPLILAKISKTYPDKLAIVSDQQSLTYEEIHQQSNQVAHYLRRTQSNQGGRPHWNSGGQDSQYPYPDAGCTESWRSLRSD